MWLRACTIHLHGDYVFLPFQAALHLTPPRSTSTFPPCKPSSPPINLLHSPLTFSPQQKQLFLLLLQNHYSTMAKLIAFAAIMVGLLALAQASRFTITTTVVDDSNQQGQGQGGQISQRCMQEMAPQSLRLRACQQFLMMPFERDMMVIRQVGQQMGQGQQELLHECCQAFHNMNEEECRCAAVSSVLYDIGQMMGAQQEQPESTKQHEFQQIRQRAMMLPQMCNVGPQQCQV